MNTALEVMQAIVDNGGPKEKNEREVCPNCGEKAWKISVPVPHTRAWGNVGCSRCKAHLSEFVSKKPEPQMEVDE